MKSVRKFIIFFSIGLLLFSLIGCGNNNVITFNSQEPLNEPPKLKVSFNDKSIDAIMGSYSWTIDSNDGTGTGINASSSIPTELVKESTALIVPTKATITVDFNDKPSNIIVNIWSGDNTIKQEIIDDKIVIPDSKGAVIYEVIATWKQGTVSYAFLVNVD